MIKTENLDPNQKFYQDHLGEITSESKYYNEYTTNKQISETRETNENFAILSLNIRSAATNLNKLEH